MPLTPPQRTASPSNAQRESQSSSEIPNQRQAGISRLCATSGPTGLALLRSNGPLEAICSSSFGPRLTRSERGPRCSKKSTDCQLCHILSSLNPAFPEPCSPSRRTTSMPRTTHSVFVSCPAPDTRAEAADDGRTYLNPCAKIARVFPVK